MKLYRWLKLDLDEDDLKESVKKVDEVGVTDDRLPKREDVRRMLSLSSLKQKALVSFMVCTGARLGEAVQVRLSDIDLEHKPAFVRFPARTTKTKKKRFSFLSSESVELLKAYIANRNRVKESTWLFDGWVPGKRNNREDRHMSGTNAYVQVRGALAVAGLVPPMPHRTNGERRTSLVGAHHDYHPHVLRAKALEVMKSSGYPTDWAEYLVGHDVGTQESYLPSEEKMAEEWLKLCEPSFCFLTSQNDVEALKVSVAGMEQAVKELKQGNPNDVVIPVKDAKGDTVLVAIPPGNNGNGKRWSNHKFDFVKCEIGSDEFDKALEEGYEVFTQADKLAYLKKPKGVSD